MRLFPNNQWLQRNVNLNCSYNQYFANFEPLCKKIISDMFPHMISCLIMILLKMWASIFQKIAIMSGCKDMCLQNKFLSTPPFTKWWQFAMAVFQQPNFIFYDLYTQMCSVMKIECYRFSLAQWPKSKHFFTKPICGISIHQNINFSPSKC